MRYLKINIPILLYCTNKLTGTDKLTPILSESLLESCTNVPASQVSGRNHPVYRLALSSI